MTSYGSSFVCGCFLQCPLKKLSSSIMKFLFIHYLKKKTLISSLYLPLYSRNYNCNCTICLFAHPYYLFIFNVYGMYFFLWVVQKTLIVFLVIVSIWSLVDLNTIMMSLVPAEMAEVQPCLWNGVVRRLEIIFCYSKVHFGYLHLKSFPVITE